MQETGMDITMNEQRIADKIATEIFTKHEGPREASFKIATSMPFDAYWEWLDNLKVGDEVMLYWTAGSFGHYKAPARLVRVNPKSVAGALTEDVADRSGIGEGTVAYPVGHIIVVPKDMTDRRHSMFFNAPMPIGVDRILPTT